MKKGFVLFLSLFVLSISSQVLAFGKTSSLNPFGRGIKFVQENSFVGNDYGYNGVLAKRGYKKGTATCKNYLGLVTIGNCGFGDAVKDGKLNVVNYVDYKTKGWFFARDLIIEVYGN